MNADARALSDSPDAEAAGEGTYARIIAAAVEACAEIGLRRVTMEDVARRARLGRATLYRHFPSKDALVRAVILTEAERFFHALDAAIAGLGSDEERLVEGFAFALEYTRAHGLLGKLLRSEPATLLPYLIGGGDLVRLATEEVHRRIHAEEARGERGREIAELLVRLVLSLALTPQTILGVEDRAGAERFARRHLVSSLRFG